MFVKFMARKCFCKRSKISFQQQKIKKKSINQASCGTFQIVTYDIFSFPRNLMIISFKIAV